MYVDVDTWSKPPSLMFRARAMTAPIKEPDWKMAQKMLNALPLSRSSG